MTVIKDRPEMLISSCSDESLTRELRNISKPHDFLPVVFHKSSHFTFASFGLFVAAGAFPAILQTLFFMAFSGLDLPGWQLLLFIYLTAVGIPATAYLMSRITDIGALIRAEKNFMQWLGTVGFSLWGGLFGGIVSLLLFTEYFGWPHLQTFDAIVFGLPLAQFFGRLGCLNYGCCHGRECQSRFALTYRNPATKILRQNPDRIAMRVYPTQPVSAMANMLIYGFMLYQVFFSEPLFIGQLTGCYLLIHGIKRFLVEFMRGEQPRLLYGGLSLWQWFSLGFMLAGTVILQSDLPVYEFSEFTAGLDNMITYLPHAVIFTIVLGLIYSLHGKELGSW